MAGIWSEDEITQYTQEGYDALVMATGCLWATTVFPDFAFAFTHTNDFEPQYIITPGILSRSAQFTSEFERDYTNNNDGPANHNYHWEQNLGYLVNIGSFPYALEDLPEDLYEIERATWNGWLIDALRSRSFEGDDNRYELNRGDVEAYTQDKDGLRRFRKWRVPSVPYSPYATDSITDIFDYTQSFESTFFTSVSGLGDFTSATDARFTTASDTGPRSHNYQWETTYHYAAAAPTTEFGVLIQITEIDSDTPIYQYGDFVQVQGQHAFGDPWGIIVAIYSEPNDVRIEYRRRGVPLDQQDFEIPVRYQTYVRHYAQARALEREGDGQDLALAAHYQSRYEAGLQRMLKRKQAMAFQQKKVIGGIGNRASTRKPLVRLPWNYGQVIK